jgi:ferritin-like protein
MITTFTDFVNKTNKLNKFAGYDIPRFFWCALAEEFLAWYFYIMIGNVLAGKERPAIEKFFAETAEDEYGDHAKWLMKRMKELNIYCNEMNDPASWNTFAAHKYTAPAYGDVMNTSQALTIAIQMEKDAIETYKAFELATRDSDPVSNQKIREILADEEEHLEALNSFSLDMLNVND